MYVWVPRCRTLTQTNLCFHVWLHTPVNITKRQSTQRQHMVTRILLLGGCVGTKIRNHICIFDSWSICRYLGVQHWWSPSQIRSIIIQKFTFCVSTQADIHSLAGDAIAAIVLPYIPEYTTAQDLEPLNAHKRRSSKWVPGQLFFELSVSVRLPGKTNFVKQGSAHLWDCRELNLEKSRPRKVKIIRSKGT